MPILATATGSFFAGRRANAFSAPAAAWDPSTDITSAIWFDASDTSSYTLSGSNVTAVTDKAGNATVTVGGTTNTGLSTQDLINDYLQSQGLNMNNLNPAIDYYNIGNIGFNPLGNNNFYNPMNSTIDFSSLPIVTDPNAPKGFAPVGIASLDF